MLYDLDFLKSMSLTCPKLDYCKYNNVGLNNQIHVLLNNEYFTNEARRRSFSYLQGDYLPHKAIDLEICFRKLQKKSPRMLRKHAR